MSASLPGHRCPGFAAIRDGRHVLTKAGPNPAPARLPPLLIIAGLQRGAGLPIFGKSSAEPPSAKNTRIDFQFDRAAFDLRILPFSIPYPVPFRLIGDEGKVQPVALSRAAR